MKIVEVEKLASSNALSTAAARGSLSLMERGLVNYGAAWDKPAIGALDGDRCVGVLVLSHDDVENFVTVSLAWCDPAHPAALTRLLVRLRQWVRRRKAEHVYFTAHDANTDMARAAEAVSAEAYSRTYRVAI